MLAPLEALYAAALRLSDRRWARLPLERLQWPVVSVGNLSVGGTGKTPFVMYLADLFARHGWRPDVLSRGFGRSGVGVERVRPGGESARYGDEPLMIAQVTGVPVFVGASRYEAGRAAERELPHQPFHVHLLDDGFQHRRLARAADLVLVHRSDLHQRLLPAGRLREPLTALKRADVIVLREQDDGLQSELESYVRTEASFWRVRRSLSFENSGKRTLAFCAIARPEEFFREIEAGGAEIGATQAYRDHHRYTVRDVKKLIQLAARQGCGQFLTTEKDAVKLTGALHELLLSAAPLIIARLRVQLQDEDAAFSQLQTLLSPEKECGR